jgi:WNK lysine deficient protein kinase
VKKIQNKYIIEYLACWFGKETRTLNIITTHLDTLQDFISKVKTLRWRIIKKWSKQILRGLDHLHQQKPEIIHRNVTSSHVYIDGGLGTLNIGDLWMATVLVEDFDNPIGIFLLFISFIIHQRHLFATILVIRFFYMNSLLIIQVLANYFFIAIGLSDAMLQQLALGSIAYIAPESFTEVNLTTKVDIYSFGMCLLEMITREEPYSEHKICNGVMYSTEIMTEKIKKKVLSNIPPRSLLRIRHPLAIAFIEECLKPVKYRLSASELLLHEFLIPTVDDDREIILDPKSENDNTEVDVNDNNCIENNSIIDVVSAVVSDHSDSLKEPNGGRKYVDTSISIENDIDRSNFNNNTIGGELFQQDGIEFNGVIKTDVNMDNQHDNNIIGAMINGNVEPKNMIESCLPSTVSSSFSLNDLNFCCLKDPDDLSEKSERGEETRINLEPRDESLKNLMNIENRVNDLSVPELSNSRILSSRSDRSSSDKGEDSIIMSTIDTLRCLSNDASTLQSLSIEDNYDNFIRIDSDLMKTDSNEKPRNDIIDIKLGYDQIISNSDRILLAIKERESRLGKVLEDFEQVFYFLSLLQSQLY